MVGHFQLKGNYFKFLKWQTFALKISVARSTGPYSIPWSPAAPAVPKLNYKFLILYQWKICILRNTVHCSWSPLRICALQKVMEGMKKGVGRGEWE